MFERRPALNSFRGRIIDILTIKTGISPISEIVNGLISFVITLLLPIVCISGY